MLLYRRFLRALGVVAVAGLALGLACKGSSKGSSSASSTFALTGTVTYTRIPLAKDANGVPTGLADASVSTNLQTLPARGVLVRAYQRSDETLPDGSTKTVWLVSQNTTTDSSGNYSMTVPLGKPVMVEVLSSFNGGGFPINVVGDPAGIGSTLPEADRLRYALRKAVDGTAPAGNPTPSALPAGPATVNFSVGLTDPWWLVNPSYNAQTQVAALADQAVAETTLPGRTVGTGSRILAIGDSIATFLSYYPRATPGAQLDLHYAPGVSDPRGTFIEYDPSVYPLAITLDPASGSFTHCYFGSIQGGSNDDAWDEGVLFPLFARNLLYIANLSRTFGMPGSPLRPQGVALNQLSPDQALIEGMADAIAANLLKSPYLADTQGTALASPVVDIRDLSALSPADHSPDSAPTIRALSWEIILKANSLPSPGTPTDWNNINPLAVNRFFSGAGYPAATPGYETEPLNLFRQISRLQEAKTAAEPVDLTTLFPDSVLTPLLAPFDLPWPRPATGAYSSFAASWGADPNSLVSPLPPFILSMSQATLVHGVYPNNTPGEVAYAGFTLSADRAFTLTVTASPALASTAQLELMLPSYQTAPLFFSGAGGSLRVVLSGNNTTPIFHPVRLRLLSPTVQQPDTTVTVSLVPAS